MPGAGAEADHSEQLSSDPGEQRTTLGPGIEESLEEGKAETVERRMA